MLKSEFEKIPNGTIFKIPGVRKVFVKAQVYFEEQYLALPYDGRRNILPHVVSDLGAIRRSGLCCIRSILLRTTEAQIGRAHV